MFSDLVEKTSAFFRSMSSGSRPRLRQQGWGQGLLPLQEAHTSIGPLCPEGHIFGTICQRIWVLCQLPHPERRWRFGLEVIFRIVHYFSELALFGTAWVRCLDLK